MLAALCAYAGFLAALIICWSNIDRPQECIRRQFGYAFLTVAGATSGAMIAAMIASDWRVGVQLEQICTNFTAGVVYSLLLLNTIRALYRSIARQMAIRGWWFTAS